MASERGIPSDIFVGDFDFLPIASHLHDGELPLATSEAFQIASTAAVGALHAGNGILTKRAAALVWRMEAIRERLGDHGADVCSKAVMSRVAARLHQAATE